MYFACAWVMRVNGYIKYGGNHGKVLDNQDSHRHVESFVKTVPIFDQALLVSKLVLEKSNRGINKYWKSLLWLAHYHCSPICGSQRGGSNLCSVHVLETWIAHALSSTKPFENNSSRGDLREPARFNSRMHLIGEFREKITHIFNPRSFLLLFFGHVRCFQMTKIIGDRIELKTMWIETRTADRASDYRITVVIKVQDSDDEGKQGVSQKKTSGTKTKSYNVILCMSSHQQTMMMIYQRESITVIVLSNLFWKLIWSLFLFGSFWRKC